MRKIFLSAFTLLFYSLPLFPQWSNNPNNPLIVGYGQDPKICSDGNGGCFITYNDQISYPKKLLLERFDKFGYRSWPVKYIAGEYPQQWQTRIVEDSVGGVIVAYEDVREYPFFWNVRVQRIDSSGNLLWDSLGVRVSTSPLNTGNCKIISDGENGAVVTWINTQAEYRVNRINSIGQRVWGDSGVYLLTYGNMEPPNLISGEDSSYYFFVGKNLMKLSLDGEIIRHDNLSYYISICCPDGNDGLIILEISWEFYPNIQLRARRFDSSGNNLWEPYVLVAESLHINNSLKIIKDNDYFFFNWWGKKNGISVISQFQALRLDGSLLFSQSIPADSSKSTSIRGIIPTDSGRVIIIWEGNSSLQDSTFAQLYDTLGNKLWNNNGVLLATSGYYREFTSDIDGGVIIGGIINDFTIVLQQISKNGLLGEVPVELTAFNAEVVVDCVILKWQTATETNNKGFEIQKLFNDIWSEIGFVEGKGTTTQITSYSFSDNDISPGKFRYRLKQIDFDGSFSYSDEIEVNLNKPNEYILYQNYPNPFNSTTNIKFLVPRKDHIKLSIYNLLGEEKKVLIDNELEEGKYNIEVDANTLSSGVYFYQFKTEYYSDTKKFILLK